ncbi:MAG TPA: helix-turn-helix transcriptional regulator [Candidatus Avamphibacillus intestinigallinarum]|nr:helix-turn-helix transcriptional regulator [Candidatus Avamphibacillus intestinigallinarum]
MNLSKQIRYYRKRDNISQEELAEKIYVSRQSISNWENERSYPDIHNLLMMSVLFNVSLDDLVKGDVEMMKEELQRSTFIKWTYVMTIFILLVPISIAPVIYLFGYYGLIITLIFYVIGMVATFKVEKWKKERNIKTYRQITDFIEGKPVNRTKPKEKSKLLKVGLVLVSVLASGLISFLLVYLGMTLFGI